jgi:hypothetical protein
MILLSIVNRSLYERLTRAQFDSSLGKDFTQIYLNDFPNEEFYIKGNKQREIDIVIGSSILDKLNKFKNTLYLLEIGRGTRISTCIELEIEPNIILYIDSESLEETKLTPLKAKLIVDTLIDIAENIEKLPYAIARTPPLLAEEHAKEDLAFQELDGLILSILGETTGNLSREQITAKIMAIYPSDQNPEIIQALLRLVQNGKLSKSIGDDRMIRYSIKR